MKIPIVIGVTGHRDLRPQDIPNLRKIVHTELQKLKDEYSHSEFVMLSSLAAGADTVCAEEALQMGISLICPLPMNVEEYSKDFSGEELDNFKKLLSKADEVFIAPHTEPEKENRDYLYRQAGIYVAVHSHVLLALWDGSEAKPEGCGTAETVSFMLKADYDDGSGHFRAANDGAVVHIVTPRQSGQQDIQVSVKLIEAEAGSLAEVLTMTDGFNKDAENFMKNPEAYTLLPDEYVRKNRRLKCLNDIFGTSDKLSMHFQSKYLKAVKCFSLFGFLLVLFFLLYDELELNFFLLCYGALIIIYLAAFVIVKRKNVHEKYLQYRVLSETVRAQFYLMASGLNVNIGNEFTWTQKWESTWVKEAISALLIGVPVQMEIQGEIIKKQWIDGQFAYHKKAFKRDSQKRRINEQAARCMLIASIVLFAAVLILELLLKSVVTFEIMKTSFPDLFMQHQGQMFTVRCLMKIILGGVSAITALLANYYGKLSFERKSIDHEKMAALYKSAGSQYESGQFDNDQLFIELAREEIIENGNWMSYCKENPPSFNL